MAYDRSLHCDYVRKFLVLEGKNQIFRGVTLKWLRKKIIKKRKKEYKVMFTFGKSE